MARTPYNDPEAEKAYQEIATSTSKPSGTQDALPDMDLTSYIPPPKVYTLDEAKKKLRK